jgi:hypothetical protein
MQQEAKALKIPSVLMTRRTYDRNTDKGEVGGSSPPRPTIILGLSGISTETSTHNPTHTLTDSIASAE